MAEISLVEKAVVNITAVIGDSWYLPMVFKKSDGTLQDLTGATFTCVIRVGEEFKSNTAVAYTLNSSELVFTALTSKIEWIWSDEVTSSFSPTFYNYVIKQNIGGDVKTRVSGTINFKL